MESTSKVEAIKQAIKQIMEEAEPHTKSKSNSNSDDDDGGDPNGDDNHHHRLLSKLMSQLEKLEDEPEADSDLTKSNRNQSKLEQEQEEEERVVKELKEVKRQNFITHCLLSAMIVLTVVWQISEVSIILKLKDGVSHPFRSIGSMFINMIKPRKSNGNDEEMNLSSSITSNLIESTPVNDLKIPELPHVELPKIDFFNMED